MKNEQDIFNKIIKWSNNRKQPSGLSQEVIQKVSDYCGVHFGCPLPTGYKDFLGKMNGFSYDGYSIFCCFNDDIESNFPRFASLDLVSFNTRFSENTDITEYIILGKSSIDYIAYVKATNNYVFMTNGTMDIIKEFTDFNEMLETFFRL